MATFFTNWYCIHVSKYNLFCLYNATYYVFLQGWLFPLDNQLVCSSLHFLSFLWFYVWGWGLMDFSHPLWHIHSCHPCSAHVWTVILMKVYGYRKHNLTKYFLALWLLQYFCPPPPPHWSLRLRFESILKLYPLGWGSTTLRFDWLLFF